MTGITGCAGFLGTAIFTQGVGVFFNLPFIKAAAGFRIMFLVFAVLCLFSTLFMMRLNKKFLQSYKP